MHSFPCAASVQNCGKEADMNTQKLNILCGRLSRDDEMQGSSNSILNQQQLLEEYANKNFVAELRRRLDVRRGGVGNIVVGVILDYSENPFD